MTHRRAPDRFVRSTRAGLACLVFAAGVAAVPVAAQEAPQRQFVTARQAITIPRVQTPPTIDDFLSGEPPSRPDLVVTAFLQRDPGDLVPASERTEAYLSYDHDNLYVVFVCRAANPSQVRARMARREAMYADDHVGLLLDTFNDRQRAYMFFVSPLGIQGDGIATEGQSDDMSFDALWHSRGAVTPFGYVVSMAIPFKSLRFAAANPQSWGIALMRAIPVNNEVSFWPGITRKLSGFTNQFADMNGLDGVSPGRNIQLVPYGTFTGARLLADANVARETDARVGIDAKLVVRDAFTFDITGNPDFSQVESDEPQVTINQRFEVFFPEKRPFFLENSGYFQTPITLFFSRRVRDPQAGVRVTGKAGGWAVGAIAIDDRAPGRARPEGDPLDGDRAVNAVVRTRREFGDSSVGGLVTSRAFGSSFNRVASADTRLRLNPVWFFDGQAAVSDTESLDGTRRRDSAFVAAVNRSGRNLSYSLNYTDIGPAFEPSLGFVPRTDIRQVFSFGSYRWRPKSGRVVSYGPNSFVQATWDRGGVLQDWIVRFPFQVEFRGQSFLFARRAEIMERFGGVEFRQHENLAEFFTSRYSWLDFSMFVAAGTRPNFFPAPGLAPFLARFRDAAASATFRPLSGLLIEQRYIYSRLSAHPDSGQTGTIFDNHILRSRVNYQFSRELSLRAIVDYNGVLSNPSLIALDRTKNLTADVLFTYLLNPGTALYVGYTDRYANVAFDAAGTSRFIDRPTTATGRQFFVKSSYLFRF
jgi:hypothetical protein